MLSQETDLEVSRKVACDLATWARREFPSVALGESSVSSVDQEAAAGATGSAMCPLAGSLRNVRKGVETTVRACVLEVSGVERTWMWETAGGKTYAAYLARYDNIERPAKCPFIVG